MALDADNNTCHMATDLQDTVFVARIVAGDVVAIDVMYYLNCFSVFQTAHQSFMKKNKNADGGQMEEKKIEAQAFIEFINFIENSVEDDDFCFKLSELHHKYADGLVACGFPKIKKVGFKEQVFSYFPKGQVQNDGKHAVLIFE
ncbi:hypothetical protein NDU88_002735 [Pleurodeles waltl]|uniref:Uncharacterized protein n=1 Tax=Pleurodeles waltl TaxID=8319 RepID=A0AAV7T3B7_PLEWA|nr:hypothetical protein NDU88_002735 [Pleurodeles waltl]